MCSLIIDTEDSYFFRTRPDQLESRTSKSSGKIRRIILDEKESASMTRPKGHNCNEVDYMSTAIKVHTRLSCSIYRFGMAYAWECPTSRGPTRYNGGRDHCGQGMCEAAHAAFTPNLYDQKLSIIQSTLANTPFSNLDVISKSYLSRRFDLQPKDIDQLSSPSEKIRMDYFAHLSKRMTTHELKGSISGSFIEQLRNSTYSNPKASNRVDCYLERNLRIIEDKLAAECSSQVITPEEAAIKLQTHYATVLQNAEQDLIAEKIRIKELHAAWNDLILNFTAMKHSSGGKASNYLQAIQKYQKVYTNRMRNRLKGAPAFKALMELLNKHQSLKILSKIAHQDPADINAIKFVLKTHAKHLTIPQNIDTEFANAYLQIDQRLEEVKIQLREIITTPQEINVIMKSMFGVKDEFGELQSPTKNTIAFHLIEALPQRAE